MTYRYVCFNCDPNGLCLHDHEVDVLPGKKVTTEFWGARGTTQFGGSVVCGACQDYIEKHAMCRTCNNGVLEPGYDDCACCLQRDHGL